MESDVLSSASGSSMMVLVPDSEVPVISVGSDTIDSAAGIEQVHLVKNSVSSHSLLAMAGHLSKALALGERLRSIPRSSENGTPIVLNKQMLSYYWRAKKE
jgi:hypothetical protein